MMNNSPSATKRSSEQSRVALDGKVQFHLFGSPCIQIASRLNSFSYLVPRGSSRPTRRASFFRSAFSVPSGMERASASTSLATVEKMVRHRRQALHHGYLAAGV